MRGKALTYHLLVCLIALMTSLNVYAQKEAQAKALLDKLSNSVAKDSGIQADFTLNTLQQQQVVSATEGSLSLKGNRFILKTPGVTTWFDGKTQWTYITENEEINISTPTEEELRSINPYSFIHLYKKGFNYRMGNGQSHKGKAVKSVVLTPENSQEEIKEIELTINPNTIQLEQIKIRTASGDETRIDIQAYKRMQNFPDRHFTLDKKRYPQAEIIDLR